MTQIELEHASVI